MNKTTLALVLGTGLTLHLAAPTPRAHADAIQTIATPTISADTFNQDFTALTTPVTSPFQFAGATSPSGMIQSQVFQGVAGSQYAGLYAYGYQVQTNANDGSGSPSHVDSASLQFNATPVGTNLAGPGTNSFGYVITNGQVGGLSLAGSQAPSVLSWQPDQSAGFIRAQYVDPASQTSAIAAGSNSATFVLMTTQAPLLVNGAPPTTVNVGGGAATTTVPVAYSTGAGTIEPIPVPEPATILAWAGMAGCFALVRRFRKTRLALA